MRIFRFLSLSALLAICVSANAVGYVTRDCPIFGAKEAINADYAHEDEYFFTAAAVLSKNAKSWTYFRSGDSWRKTWRSYAGTVLKYNRNTFYRGYTYGVHYWYNRNAGRAENRRELVSDCQITRWGYNNWNNW